MVIDIVIAVGMVFAALVLENYVTESPGRAVIVQLTVKVVFGLIILMRYLQEKAANAVSGDDIFSYVGLGMCVAAFTFGQIVLAVGANEKAGMPTSLSGRAILKVGRTMQRVLGFKK